MGTAQAAPGLTPKPEAGSRFGGNSPLGEPALQLPRGFSSLISGGSNVSVHNVTVVGAVA